MNEAEDLDKNPVERRKDWLQASGIGLEPVAIDHWEFVCTDGVFIKQMHLQVAFTFVPQHQHRYSHHSMLARGSVRVWRDTKWLGDYQAPTAILIPAGEKHTFMSLEPDTVLYCIHNVQGRGAVEITGEHQLNVSLLQKV